jgi:hypothetical protein
MLKRRILIAALSFTVYGWLPAKPQTGLLPERATVQTDSNERHHQRSRVLWLVSIPVFVAANILDAQSSWGKREVNPFLQSQTGQFDGRSAAIKFGGSAAIILGEYSLSRWFKGTPKRQHELYVGSAWANFLGAGALTGAAIHNYRQPSAPVPGQR